LGGGQPQLIEPPSELHVKGERECVSEGGGECVSEGGRECVSEGGGEGGGRRRK
jgi:hypothetical protein